MEIKHYYINEQAARIAKDLNSFSSYEEGSASAYYSDLVQQFRRAVEELLEDNANSKYPVTDEQMELIEYYCDRYSEKLANAINRMHSIDSMCPSVMISGAGNFPTRKKEKQNAARDKFWSECGDLFEPTDSYYFKKIKNILTNKTIYSNDALAVEKLQAKLEELEEKQASMKAMNAYYRKHGTMVGYEGLSEATAQRLDNSIESHSWEKKPFPSWQLTNNNATIKATKNRIAELEALKERAAQPVEDKYPTVDGVQVVENAEAMRVQMIFEGKPDEATRDLLKSNGFRWSPRYGAWQRQLTSNGIFAVKKVLAKLQAENVTQRN